MKFFQEQGSPHVVRSRYYRLNPHFRPAAVAGEGKKRKAGFFSHRSKLFWVEFIASVMAVVILAILIMFPTEIDSWVRRHFPETKRVMPPHAVATFHNSNWTPGSATPALPPPPAH